MGAFSAFFQTGNPMFAKNSLRKFYLRSISINPSQIERYLRLIMILLSLVAGIVFFLGRDWVTLASAILCIFLLAIPPLFNRLSHFNIPLPFRFIYLGFIFTSMYLGELHSFFYRFGWWDDLLHTCSAMMLAYCALILAHILNKDKQIADGLLPAFLALFILTFTMGFGAVWELFEFVMDRLLGVNMLKGRDPRDLSGIYDNGRALVNTMQDLILDLSGGLFISILSFYQLRKRILYKSGFGYLLRVFLAENQGLIKRGLRPD